jgi:transcriptional regulator with XRE-family HTH domain
MHIGLKIKKLRIEKKLSQEQLGKELGVSKQQIGHIEKGRNNPSVDQVEILNKLFETNLMEYSIAVLPSIESELEELKRIRVQLEEGLLLATNEIIRKDKILESKTDKIEQLYEKLLENKNRKAS